MKRDSNLEVINETMVRVKGTRVGIETIVNDFQAGLSPEETALRFPSVSLRQVYGVIEYYLAHTEVVDKYMRRVLDQQLEGWRQQEQNPSAFVQQLRQRLVQNRLPTQHEAQIPAR